MSAQQRSARDQPQFIAHRGAAEAFPENSLLAVHGALTAGVRHVEVDVQLSADRVPMLAHDPGLLRTAGSDRLISAALASELTLLNVGEPQRFGSRFSDVCMPTLAMFIETLAHYDEATAFVEIKRDALAMFGHRRVLSAVLPVLSTSRHKIVLISFDLKVLELARQSSGYAIGLVLSDYGPESELAARALAPEYLFCKHERVRGNASLWAGPWHWAIYEITDLAQARMWHRRGARFIESMAAVRLAQEASASA